MPIASIALLLASIATPTLIQACASGKIPVNSIAGLRIRYVMASEAAWRVGHKAALVPTWIGACIAAVLTVLSLLATFSVSTQGVIIGLAALVLVVAIGTGAFLADRAALNEIALEHDHDQ